MLSVSKVSLITSISLAAFLAYMQRTVISSTELIVWCSLMVFASLLRAALVFSPQLSPVSDDAARVRLAKFRLGVMVAGAVWGSAGFLLFPVQHPEHEMFLIFTLAGMTAGGVASFSADLVSAVAFSVLIILPLAIRLIVAGR